MGLAAKDNRSFVNGVPWVLRSDAQWKHLPEEYDNWKSVHRRVARRAKSGIWQRIFEILLEYKDKSYVMINSTIVRVHLLSLSKGGSGWRMGNKDQAIVRSRGGLAAKIHKVCNARGQPMRFALTSGQASDGPRPYPWWGERDRSSDSRLVDQPP